VNVNTITKRQPSARSAEPGPISQYAPSSRPAAHTARRPDVRARRQTASSLNDPWAGHNKYQTVSISLIYIEAPCYRYPAPLKLRPYGAIEIRLLLLLLLYKVINKR